MDYSTAKVFGVSTKVASAVIGPGHRRIESGLALSAVDAGTR